LDKRAKILKSFFVDAGGAFIKFGQLLALRIDVLPKETALEMMSLFDHVKPFSLKEAENIFLEELGSNPRQIFSYFEKEPFASASFGQVYAAKLPDGQKVIVKIQRPGIREQVYSDFVMITFLSILADLFFKIEAMPWREFAREFKEWTIKELDYQIEAANTQRVYDNVYKLPKSDVVIPKTYHRYTTKKILVQEYIDGIPLSTVMKEIKSGKHTIEQLEEMGVEIKKAPKILIIEMARQYFLDGFFHADLHPGNILLLEKGKIGLIDFGITGEATSKRYDFAKLIEARLDRDFKKSGFYLLKFAGDQLLQILNSAFPANIEEKYISELLDILASHFDEYIRRTEVDTLNNIKDMKKDYAVMVLDISKYSQRYNIRFPKEMYIFMRAISIIGFMAKEMDKKFDAVDTMRKFFIRYPIEKSIPKRAPGEVLNQRINREEAIEKLNNWLMFLLEVDQDLYNRVGVFISKIDLNIAK
jgi:ubiquinone biosynthesis protein